MEKVIVTGGVGFIGSNLVDALIEEGVEVSVIDNQITGKETNINSKAKLHEVDIRDRSSLEDIFKGGEYVFHTAAIPNVQYSIDNPLETHEVNVTGVLNLLDVLVKKDAKKFILSSSASVYGENEKELMKETDEPDPKSPYALHKYIAEEYCKLWSKVYGLPTVSLRYFNVYGNRQNVGGYSSLVIAKFLEKRKKGEKLTITGDGNQTRDFVHVRDVVRANILAARSEDFFSGETINIGSGLSTSVNQIAEYIGGEVEYIDPRFEPKHSLSDNSKAKKLLNWEPSVFIKEGIKELKISEGLE